MFVREVPFDSFTLALGALFVLVISGTVCFAVAMIWDGKKWSEVLMEKVYMRFILPLCTVFVAGVMMSSMALSHQRPAAEGDYEKLGTYTATVARTYPQSQIVEVETDFGVSLPVPESMMPEGAATVGSQVTVDVSRLSSKPGLIVVRRTGDGVYSSDSDGPVFVASNVCKSVGVLSCSAAFGDTKGDDGLFPSAYYAVTAVRVS